MRCSENCYFLAGIYIKRFLQARPDITVNALNVHLLILTALVTAAKYLDDTYYSNAYYANIGGVSLASINRMELEFVFSLNFDLFVSNEEFARQRSIQLRILVESNDVPALASAFHEGEIVNVESDSSSRISLNVPDLAVTEWTVVL